MVSSGRAGWTVGSRILEGEVDGGPRRGAVLYDSVTMTAFGPVCEDADEAEWLIMAVRARYACDPRQLDPFDLEQTLGLVRSTREQCGDVRGANVCKRPKGHSGWHCADPSNNPRFGVWEEIR